MKLQQIRSFVAVYQERSFTTAARRGHATQSGLSMQIKELEQALEVSLFDRSPTGVKPSKAGERFYTRALAILRELEQAQQEVRSTRKQITGTVVVGLMPTFSRAALPAAMHEFTRAHPLVRLKIVEAYSAALITAVKRGEMDFAVVPPSDPDIGLTSKFVDRDIELFVTSLDTKHRHLAPVSLADIGPLNLIVPSAPNARRARIDTYLAAVGAKIESVVEMDAMMGTLDVIARGRWVAILPNALCFPDIKTRVRKLHPIIAPPLTVDYVLINSASKSLSPAARAFAALLTSEIRHLCTEGREMFGTQSQ